ncbi:cellulase family glycosylhydrolase [Flavimarina sp. Hel_I_48]|uniref:cellulase family glycosylhydrolase n=1 Tax=Flavimarina sp. Hel_I_48 TaxID=1392488 RepID=UPI00055F1F0E|nr:cellulase family glycosylhydrolase [Flavimarina sp. Hel_I_48]
MNLFNVQRFLMAMVLFVATISCANDDVEVVAAQSLDFSITPSEISFDPNGGNTLININTETDWELTVANDWLTVSSNKGSKAEKITLKALMNSDTIARNSVLSLKSGDSSQDIQVNQAAAVPADDNTITYAIPADSTGMSSLPAVEFASQMHIGWNVGNSLEAVGGETAWGNPMITEQLIDAVQAAGFDAVRIPVSWSQFSNEAEFTIQDSWLDRVQEVVDYALANDMYVIMNEHWDGGWMQPTRADQEYVNTRLEAMWTQIATHFREYGDHLLFAGTNEVMVEGDYSTPTEDYYTVQNSFNQTFVDAVRATGGKNVYRYLVVQGFNTNIDHTVNYAEIPEDVVAGKLMMEVHYYDPFNFTLNQDSTITQWGNDAEDPTKVESWANESHVDSQFQRMKTTFIDEGVAVILGEYGAISHTEIEGHDAYRNYYLQYVTQTAKANGLVPFYWDNGFAGNYGFALFNRAEGTIIEPELITTLINAAQ